MTIEEIMELWESDSKIDRLELEKEVLKIASLHNKYYRIFVEERMRLRGLEAKMKQLKLDKYEFLTQGPNEESLAKGWSLPAKGMILKAEIPMYLEADRDIIELSLKIGMQQEKIEFLESIIKSFVNRGFNIKTAIDIRKFENGG